MQKKKIFLVDEKIFFYKINGNKWIDYSLRFENPLFALGANKFNKSVM